MAGTRKIAAILVADVVGPTGKVVAIDREQRAVDVARSRGSRGIEADQPNIAIRCAHTAAQWQARATGQERKTRFTEMSGICR